MTRQWRPTSESARWQHPASRTAAPGACSTTGTKTSQVNNADGSRTTTTDYYYDTACATLEAEEKITVTTPATLGNTTGTGSIISYDKATQAVRVSQTLALNVTTTAASQGSTVNRPTVLRSSP